MASSSSWPLALADGVEGGLEEVHVADAGDFDGILEGEEDAVAGALFGGQVEEILAFDRVTSPPVTSIDVAAGEDLGERAFAGAVGAHDGVDFAGVDGEVDALQNFTVSRRWRGDF